MNEHPEAEITLRWNEPEASYDVVIVGGGGHGLSTAYHLATRHDITRVLVLDAGYIGDGVVPTGCSGKRQAEFTPARLGRSTGQQRTLAGRWHRRQKRVTSDPVRG